MTGHEKGAAGARILPWVRRALCILALLPGLAACAPEVRVKSSFDPNASFARYGTFAMLVENKAVQTAPDVDPFLMQRLRQLTYQSLVARGLRAVPLRDAALLVAVQSAVRSRTEVYPRSSSYGYYGPAWTYPGWGYDVYAYDEGLVVIDLIDPQTKAVVWRGTGARQVTGPVSDAELARVVGEILDQYPPGAREDDGE